MPSKSLRDWLVSAWKGVAAVFIIIGGLASLQALGLLQVLVNALSLLSGQVPIYLVGILVAILIVIVVVTRFAVRNRGATDSVLRIQEARRIVRLCATPQPTDFLRSNYEAWERASTVLAFTAYGFDDMIKDMEKQGFLRYSGGKWRATNKAFKITAKYHGDV